MKVNDFNIRAYVPETDEAFIFDTWLRAFRRAKPMRNLKPEEYFSRQRAVISKVIKENHILVAEEPNTKEFLSYVVFRTTSDACILHWLYTKLVFRNMGIGRTMMDAAVGDCKSIFYTHKPSSIWGEKMTKSENIFYSPKLI